MTTPAAPEPVVVGVDIGGTSIKGIVSGRDGVPRARLERLTPTRAGGDAVVDAVTAVAAGLADAAGVGAVPVGVGLVMPGVLDRAAGIARWSANIGWRDLPIAALVGGRLGLPVAIEHDVRAAGLAEVDAGAAHGLREVLFVSIGTGLAAALVTGGAVVAGATGLAGEIGHVPVFPDGEPCACGQRGCAEAYASAASVARRYARASGSSPVPAEVVVARAAAGDGTARAVWDDAVTALSRVILGAVLLADPEAVVLGGGMAAAGAALTGPLHERLREALPWRASPPVVVSRFGSQAGARGAALLAWTAVPDRASNQDSGWAGVPRPDQIGRSGAASDPKETS